MHRTLPTLGTRFTAIAAALAAWAGPAQAADRYWAYASGCGSADFASASCWRLGAPGQAGGGTSAPAPVAGDRALLVHNTAVDLNVNFANVGSGPMPEYQGLVLAGTGAGVMGLNIDRNTLRVSAEAFVGAVTTGGSVGRGRIVQSGGAASFNSLRVTTGSEYRISGGTLSADFMVVEPGASISQSGGVVTGAASSWRSLGGTYFLDGGTLDLRGTEAFSASTGRLELSGGTLRLNPGQAVRIGTLDYLGGGGDMLRDLTVDANVLNLRNDFGPARVINLANDVRAGTLNVGGSGGLAGNSSTASFIGGNHVVTGTMTVSAGAGHFSYAYVNGALGGTTVTTQRLDLGSADADALGAATLWVQDGGSLVVNGTAHVGQANRNGSLLATRGGSVQVNGSLNVFGSAFVSASGLRASGSTTVGGRVGASLTIAEGGQFAGEAMRNLAGGTVTVMDGGQIISAGPIPSRFDNDGLLQFSRSGGSLHTQFRNSAGGSVRVDAGATARFLGSYVGTGGLDIATGGVARFGEAGSGIVTRSVGFTGGGRSEYAGMVILDMAGFDIADAGDFVLLDSASLRFPLGGGRLNVGGQLGFAGALVVQAGAIPLDLSEGSRFDLFDWGSTTGRFVNVDFSAAPLASGLVWDTSELYSQGVVRVSAVPEPGAWAMWLAGMASMGALARRRRA